ncbi:alpha/beta hydrolase [Streptomyces sp. NPDC056519]|uniref:alpha/beta hydrolase n=1 Tax=Streptomyces sp. NPDC056519 TaxID=3345849 RepID=UPI0036A51824
MFRFTRLRRGALAIAVVVTMVLPLTAASRYQVPAPAPARLPPVTAQMLPQAYAANQATVLKAVRDAQAAGAEGRTTRLQALAREGRQFLTFDGRGPGRVVEVLGDLARANRIAVLVPGADTSVDTYDSLSGNPPEAPDRQSDGTPCEVPAGHTAARVDSRSLGGAAVELSRELCKQDPAARTAVVTWLGYDTPKLTSPAILTDGSARDASPALRAFVATMHQINPKAKVSMLCHSYGSVVCARSAEGLDVSNIVLFGSPGVGASDVAALHTPATVWAGRGASDWIAKIPHLSIGLPDGSNLGFGQDPTAASFGARHFPAGPGGHSDYFNPGSLSLYNLARIILDRRPETAHA